MAKRKKSKSPARVRYEQKRPTFSFRTYKELNDRARAVKKAEGISNTNIVEIAVGLLEVKVRSEEEIKKQAYEKGELSGYELAESEYKVTYPCSVCGKPIDVTTDKEKRAIATYMREHGWGHGDCIDRRY